MATFTTSQTITSANWCNESSLSSTQNLSIGDKINWTPSINMTGVHSSGDALLASAEKIITTINCTYIGTKVPGTVHQIFPSSVGDWSITFTVKHSYTTQQCSTNGVAQKTFTVSGVTSDASTNFGLHIYEPNGQDLRLDMSKRQPRLFDIVVGSPGSPSPSQFSVPITGYGYGGLDEWEAINTFSRSVYAVTGGTAATSKTGTGYVQLTKAALGTNLGVYPDIYTVDIIGYKLLIYRY